MSPIYVIRLFINPKAGWTLLHERDHGVIHCLLTHTMVFAAIPAICGYYGTTRVGWQIGMGELVRMTHDSALRIAVLYYLAMIAGVLSVGWMIRWMSKTYGAEQPLAECVALASYTATPLFLVGFVHLQPTLWLNLVAGLPALAFTTYLFYSGVPVMMEISEDRGFLFSSAVLAFGLVTLVAMLAVTVLLWGAGFAPRFTG